MSNVRTQTAQNMVYLSTEWSLQEMMDVLKGVTGEQNYQILPIDNELLFTQEELYKLAIIMAHTTEFEIINKLEKMLASDKELSDNDFNKVKLVTDNVSDLKALVGSVEIKVNI